MTKNCKWFKRQLPNYPYWFFSEHNAERPEHSMCFSTKIELIAGVPCGEISEEQYNLAKKEANIKEWY